MARSKYNNPTTQRWEYADRNPLPTGLDAGDILVWNNGAWVAKQPSRLPSAYQEVEWIGSDGTGQYINLEIDVTQNTKVIVEQSFDVPSGTGNFFYFNGTHNESADNSLIWACNRENGSTLYRVRAGNTWSIISATVDSNFHTFEIENGSQKFDGTQFSTASLANVGNHIWLFARNSTIPNYSAGKIKSFILYRGSFPRRYLVPCYLKYDGSIGLYDLITSNFYGNAGTGTFTKGADVN